MERKDGKSENAKQAVEEPVQWAAWAVDSARRQKSGRVGTFPVAITSDSEWGESRRWVCLDVRDRQV